MSDIAAFFIVGGLSIFAGGVFLALLINRLA